MKARHKIAGIAFMLLVLGSTAILTACGGEDTPAAVVGLGIEGYKEEFMLGEEFSPGALRVTATYEDGGERSLDASEYTVDSKSFRSLSLKKRK